MALRALFSFARVGSKFRTLLRLVGEAHLRHERQARSDVLSRLVRFFTKAFKFDGSEGAVSSSCVGSHRITLLCRFGGARRRRERQARSDVLSLLVAYLPQRSSSVALRALFSFARVGSQRHTLLSLVGEAHIKVSFKPRLVGITRNLSFIGSIRST